MTARGWCPSLLTPMPAHDGLLVRVKPTAAQLSATQLAALAEVAAREGNGQVQLTSRANLQVRGLTEASVERFARVVLDLGLATSDARAEQVRNVLSAPLAGADPATHDVRPHAVALETLLIAEPTFHALPAKFGFSVDGGGLAALPRSADILVDVRTESALLALPDSTVVHRTAATPAAVTAAARALLTVFLAQGARRMRHLVERIGAERIFALAGLATEPVAAPTERPLPLGYSPYGTGLGCFAAALTLGRADARCLVALADAAERYGQGQIATTPWRAFALPAVTEPRPLAQLCAAAGFIVDAADPRARTLERDVTLQPAEQLR